jgi:hypothetical protein
MPTLSINCRYLYNVVQTLSVHTLRFCVVKLAHMATILSVQECVIHIPAAMFPT